MKKLDKDGNPWPRDFTQAEIEEGASKGGDAVMRKYNAKAHELECPDCGRSNFAGYMQYLGHRRQCTEAQKHFNGDLEAANHAIAANARKGSN
jgi:hypothetical protein